MVGIAILTKTRELAAELMPLPTTSFSSMNSSDKCNLEADFQYGFFTVIYSLVVILGLPGNACALYFLCQRSQRTRQSSVYFVNLCVVDIIFISMLPIRIYYHNQGNNWVLGDAACRITGTLFYFNIYLSIGFFTCISLDCYMGVALPLTYLRLKYSRYPLVLTVAIWLLGCVIVLPLMLGGPLDNTPKNTSQVFCFESFSSESWQNRMVPYNICALIFGFLVPFAVIAVVFPLMARRVCQIKTSIHRKVALRIIGVILVISLLCFLPYNITHLFHFLMRLGFIQDCGAARQIYKLRRVTLAMVSLNSCLNPVIYFIPVISREFRKPKVFHSKKEYNMSESKLWQRDIKVTNPLYQQKPDVLMVVAKAEWSVV